jgi:predicted DCC family thiol-disulfide oxidoreductase YuxK
VSDDHVVVLVDGHCSLCKGWTYWAARRDGYDKLRFASQQSRTGGRFVEKYEIGDDTVIIVANGNAYTKSRAILEVLRVLTWPWPILYVGILIPWFIRDWAYSVIARNRHRWFGREESDFCEVNDDLDHKLLG